MPHVTNRTGIARARVSVGAQEPIGLAPLPDPSTQPTAFGRGPLLRVVLSERSESKDDGAATPPLASPTEVQRALRDPLSDFNVGLALMSVIPLLLCCYLITVKFFSLNILVGLNAYYFMLAVITALVGIIMGRRAIRKIVQQLVEANLRAAQLLSELTRAYERLQQTNAALEQSHEELRTTQLHLIQAEKLEAVGQLAAGVAHEVKNPLMAILLGVQYLAKHLSGGSESGTEETAAILKDIEEAVQRADTVVRGLLDFSAPEPFLLEAKPLNPVIEQALDLVKHELDEARVSLVTDLPRDLPPVRLDLNKLQQVFVNLFMNAIHAMPLGGALTVRTYTKPLSVVTERVGRRRSDRFKMGETAIVAEVLDTGRGIPEDNMAKLFTPFFTTKPPSQGTGLGLTVTKKIVELHGGTIEVTNRKEGGVKVTLMFHASPDPTGIDGSPS